MQYLRDNAGVLEASNNNIDWEPVVLGEGGGGVTDHTLLTNIGVNTHAQLDTHLADTALHGTPATLANPVALGTFQIRDNAGTLQFSDDGEDWSDVYGMGWELDLSATRFKPPAQAGEVPSVYEGAISMWRNTDNNAIALVYRTASGQYQKVMLGEADQPMFRFGSDGFQVSDDNATWYTLYRIGDTELTDSYFVAPAVEQATAPDDTLPALANNGSVAIWKDTANSKVYLCASIDGVIKKVEMI